jgi:hypothetical protein
MENEYLLPIVLKAGYVKSGFGYKKQTEENTHWITLFENGKIQMYAFFSEDEECDKIYDTGIIEIFSDYLQVFIEVLIRNHS